MKKQLIVVMLVILANYAHAQFLQDINGNPFAEKSSPASDKPESFYNESFLKGTIKVNSLNYNNLLLKFNQVENSIIYKKNENSPLMQPNGRVEEFTIELPTGEVVLFKRINNSTEFYEVLQAGKTTLLKYTKKALLETMAYNSITKDISITSSASYYLLMPDQALVQVKKDKKDFLKALSAKSVALDKYVKDTGINFKLDKDIAKLIAYYNTL